MDRAEGFTDDQRKIMDEVWAKKEYLFKLRGSSGWENSVDDKKAGVKIDTKKTEHDLVAVHATGIIPFSMREIFCIIHDNHYKKQYDKDIDQSHVLKKIAANTYYLYQKSKAMTFVAARDFVLMHHIS